MSRRSGGLHLLAHPVGTRAAGRAKARETAAVEFQVGRARPGSAPRLGRWAPGRGRQADPSLPTTDDDRSSTVNTRQQVNSQCQHRQLGRRRGLARLGPRPSPLRQDPGAALRCPTAAGRGRSAPARPGTGGDHHGHATHQRPQSMPKTISFRRVVGPGARWVPAVPLTARVPGTESPVSCYPGRNPSIGARSGSRNADLVTLPRGQDG